MLRSHSHRRAVLILDIHFRFPKSRTHAPRNRAPPNFHRHARRRALHERHHHHPQHLVVRMFIINSLEHVRRQRSHQSVTQQNSQQRPHPCSRNFFADFFRRPAQRSHRNNHAQHRRHDPQARQGISHRGKRHNRSPSLLVIHFHV